MCHESPANMHLDRHPTRQFLVANVPGANKNYCFRIKPNCVLGCDFLDPKFNQHFIPSNIDAFLGNNYKNTL